MLEYIKRQIKNLKFEINYIIKRFHFLKVLNSPFKGFQFKFYFGKVAVGVPYFYPRNSQRLLTEKEAIKWANKQFGTNHIIWKDMTLEQLIERGKKRHTTKLFSFDWNFVYLGYKTKWDDYRFEWNPMLSIVLFGIQFCIFILPNVAKSPSGHRNDDCYWETWLNYEYNTDKTKSKKERLEETVSKHSCTWTSWINGNKIETDYYIYILKKKYLKHYNKIKK